VGCKRVLHARWKQLEDQNINAIPYLFEKNWHLRDFFWGYDAAGDSARRIYINGYLKFRNKLRGDFRIRRWANASSRMHADGTQASCKRAVWRMPTRVKPCLVVTIKQRFRLRRGRRRKRSGGETTLVPHSRPYSVILAVFLSRSLFYTGRKRGTAARTWPCARMVSSRVAYESLHFFVPCATTSRLHF